MEDCLTLRDNLDMRLVRLQEAKHLLWEQQKSLEASFSQRQRSQDQRAIRKDCGDLQLANSHLRRELHQWRKKLGVYRLKLASTEEDASMYKAALQTSIQRAEALQQQHDRLHVLSTGLQQQVTKLAAHCTELSQRVKDTQQQAHQQALQSEQLLGQLELSQAELQSSQLASSLQASSLQAAVDAKAAEASAASQLAQTLQKKVDELTASIASIQQQLEGTQLTAKVTARKAEETATSLAASELKVKQLQEEVTKSHAAVVEARNLATSAQEQARVSEGKARVAEDSKAVAERALLEWQQVSDERRKMMETHERQLLQVSEERAKVSSDRVSAAEAQLLSQVSALQAQLSRETSTRQDSELTLRQQMVSSQGLLDSMQGRVQHLERTVLDKERQIRQLEDSLKAKEADTPARMVDRAVWAVDRLVSQLMPVAEGNEQEEGGEGCQRLPASTALGIATRAQALLEQQQMGLSAGLPPRGKAAAAQAEPPAPKAAGNKRRGAAARDAAAADGGSQGQQDKAAGQRSRHQGGPPSQSEADVDAELPAEPASQAGRANRAAQQAHAAGSDTEAAGSAMDSDMDSDFKPVPPAAKRPSRPPLLGRAGQATRDKADSSGAAADPASARQGPEQTATAATAPTEAQHQPSSTQHAQHHTFASNERPGSAEQPTVHGAALAAKQDGHGLGAAAPAIAALQGWAASSLPTSGACAAAQPEVPTLAVAPPAHSLTSSSLLSHRPRVMDNPLAALNPRVLEAAALHRQALSQAARDTLRPIAISKPAERPANGKKKLLKTAISFLPQPQQRGATERVPLGLLTDSLQIPVLKK
ncbi:uncharacterized protein HaLaN_11694 [Haematococcus lacustris]|uniref:Uncharacterized protein n=1 Tax=Haematococcus lacustris TaxID=44745 RepID=A0A699Z0E3_HAELA|nr:uncharacterized protein HaLaN_11694 [Haematococcus lacustris]